MASSEDTAAQGPSKRAVAIARGWLIALGGVWLVTGALFLALASAPIAYWGIAMVVLGLGHFIAVRYAGGRLAVFLALFGP